jgi:hypothetical protein
MQVHPIRIDDRAGEGGDGGRCRAVADGKGELVLGDDAAVVSLSSTESAASEITGCQLAFGFAG